MNIGERIQFLRNEKSISQQELAKDLDVVTSTIGMIEINKRMPSNDLEIKIADYFNVSLDYLHGRTEIRETASGDKEIPSNIKILLRSKDVRNLTDDQAKALAKIAKEIFKNNQ